MSASGECEEELIIRNGCLMWHNNELAHTVLMLCPAVTLRQDCDSVEAVESSESLAKDT